MTEPQQNSERSLSKSEPEYAGFWIRFLAFLIDIVILKISLIIVLYLLTLVVSASIISTEISIYWLKQHSETIGGIELLNVFVFYWPYYALMESSNRQATLGKRVCRLKLVRKDGARLSFGRASARFWSKMVHVSVFCWLGLLVTFLLFLLIMPLLWLTLLAGTPFGIVFCCITAAVTLLAFTFLGFLPALFTARKQTLHDLIAGTVVVKAD